VSQQEWGIGFPDFLRAAQRTLRLYVNPVFAYLAYSRSKIVSMQAQIFVINALARTRGRLIFLGNLPTTFLTFLKRLALMFFTHRVVRLVREC